MTRSGLRISTRGVFSLGGDAIKGRGRAEVHDHARPPVLFKSGDGVHNAISAYFRGVVVVHWHSGLNARLDEKRLRIEVTLTNLAENRIKRRNDRGDHDAVHTRNFQAGHGEQVAEQDAVLVYGAGLHRSHAPVGEELAVARRIVRTFVRSSTSCVCFCSGKNSEHRVGVADIENEKHTSLVCGERIYVIDHDQSGLTLPLNTVRKSPAARTRRKPRSSSPSVVPSKLPPFSSMRTALPFIHDE